MEYHHRIVTCPNCGRTAEHTRTTNTDLLLGSPFRVCKHCQTTYFDNAYKEKAILVYEDTGTDFGFLGIIFLLIFNGIAAALIAEAAKNGLTSGLALGIVILVSISIFFDYALVKTIHNFNHPEEYHQKQVDYLEGRTDDKRDYELMESLYRLSSRQYLDALKNHGVKVPDYFYQRLESRDTSSEVEEESDANKYEPFIKAYIEKSKSEIANKTKDITETTIGIAAISNDDSGESEEQETSFKEQCIIQCVDESREKVLKNNPPIRFCRHCGVEIAPDAEFCHRCGTKVIHVKQAE